eukprot:748252-Hanusia_phi.AAC.2
MRGSVAVTKTTPQAARRAELATSMVLALRTVKWERRVELRCDGFIQNWWKNIEIISSSMFVCASRRQEIRDQWRVLIKELKDKDQVVQDCMCACVSLPPNLLPCCPASALLWFYCTMLMERAGAGEDDLEARAH